VDQIYITEDGYWSSVNINSYLGTACSYIVKNPNSTINTFEIKMDNFTDDTNVLVGLYYYSRVLAQIVDLGLFDPRDCKKIRHCVISESGYIMFVLEDTNYVGINLVPNDTSKDMNMVLSYRLMN
jgi:hypothetical protein